MANKKTSKIVLNQLICLKISSVFFSQLVKIMFVITLSLFINCSSTETNRDEVLQTIKIGEALKTQQKVLLSEIIEGEIEYVPLETKEESLIGNNPRFYSNESEIIVFTDQKVSIFDRKTGKYLREIGHYGRDPEGFQGTVYSYPYDEKNDLYYLNSWEQQVYLRYNSSGKLVDTITANYNIKEPDIQNSDFGEIITSIAPLNDTCFVGHVWNINGKQKTKLIIFNEYNHRIKTYPQYKTFEWDIFKDGLNIFKWNGLFYEFDNRLNFFERNSDTIFSVSLESLKPRYALEGSIFIEGISESNRFLLFKIREEEGNIFGVFDKRNNKIKVAKTTDGFENDIDGFVLFTFHSINSNNEIIGSREAFEIKHWFEQNPDKVANLAPHLQNLAGLKENDNPVLMLMKLKE